MGVTVSTPGFDLRACASQPLLLILSPGMCRQLPRFYYQSSISGSGGKGVNSICIVIIAIVNYLCYCNSYSFQSIL